MIPPYDVHTREDLPKLIDELGLKRGVEIGVCCGKFSEFLLENTKMDVLHGIDPWCEDEDFIKSVFKRCDRSRNKQEKRYEATKERLEKFGSRSVLIRKLSQQAYEYFEDDSLDFVYLDGSHRFTGFTLDLIYWYPKLKVGGLFSGHDFWHKYRCEVCPAIGSFAVEYRQLFYVTDEERKKPIYPPTWWFIKTSRDKGDFIDALNEHREYYKKLTGKLRKRGAVISLPYEYLH